MTVYTPVTVMPFAQTPAGGEPAHDKVPPEVADPLPAFPEAPAPEPLAEALPLIPEAPALPDFVGTTLPEHPSAIELATNTGSERYARALLRKKGVIAAVSGLRRACGAFCVPGPICAAGVRFISDPTLGRVPR